MNERSIERVMYAASSVPNLTAREQCIMGGIVRSIIDRGRFDDTYARHAANALIGFGFVTACQNFGDTRAEAMLPDRTDVSRSEQMRVVALFRDAYDPPARGVAA